MRAAVPLSTQAYIVSCEENFGFSVIHMPVFLNTTVLCVLNNGMTFVRSILLSARNMGRSPWTLQACQMSVLRCGKDHRGILVSIHVCCWTLTEDLGCLLLDCFTGRS